MKFKCNVCLAENLPKLLLESRNDSSSVYRCPKCKVGFAHPQPSAQTLNDYYDGMYSELTVSFDKKKMKWARTSMAGYIQEIQRLQPGNDRGRTFLDLGGGLGYYTKAAEEEGFNATLMEKDPVSVSFAEEKLGVKNILKLDMKAFFETNTLKYDIVFFRHVIEHVTDPNEVIIGISSVLNEGGLLIIETDNNAGIEILFKKGSKSFYLDLYKKSFKDISFMKLFLKRPFALDPPRHLYAFRMKNLSNLLQNAKLEPQTKIHYRLGHPIYWPNIPSPSYKKIFKKLFALKIISAIKETIAYMNLLFRIVLQKFGLSSGLCIYAQKKSTQ